MIDIPELLPTRVVNLGIFLLVTGFGYVREQLENYQYINFLKYSPVIEIIGTC